MIAFKRARQRAFPLRGFSHHRHAHRGTFVRGLDDQRARELCRHGPVTGPLHDDAGCDGNPVHPHEGLGHRFIHAHGAGLDSRTGIRNAHDLQEALHRAVLSTPTMQGEKGQLNLAGP